MRPRGKWTGIAVLIAAAAIAGGVLLQDGRKGTGGPPGPGGPREMPVETAPVERGRAVREAATVGTLQADESVVIRSEIAGRITGILFAEGQRADEGADLVNIDPAEFEAQVRQSAAAAELSRMNFERARQLIAEKMISQQGYDEIATRVKESEANLALAQARLDKTVIRAPFSGRLGLRQVSPGDYVQPGQAIVNLEAMDSLKADFRIPEVYLREVKTGQEAAVRVDSYPDRVFRGRIYAIDPRIDEASRTILLRARIPNRGGELRPGMFARVSVVLGERADALWVPEQAIVPMGEGKFVYRVVDGKAVLTPVAIGERREGRAEITEGVGPSDTVVAGGQTKIFDGMPVVPVGAAKPAAPPPRQDPTPSRGGASGEDRNGAPPPRQDPTPSRDGASPMAPAKP